jgi:hypothetical protein
MQRFNERPMRHLGLSRRELFEKIERAALNALSAEDWQVRGMAAREGGPRLSR